LTKQAKNNNHFHFMNNSLQKALLKSLIDKKLITHLSALEVYDILRKDCPKMSLATVYRNLNLCVKKGMLVKIETAKSEAVYDITTRPHIHMVCSRCGRIEDIDADFTSELSKLAKSNKFAFENYDLSIKGLCKECRDTEAADKKPAKRK